MALLTEETFSDALRSTLANGPQRAIVAAVLERRPNAGSSTFESEIVTCRLADGRELKLLCKHEQFRRSNARDHESWGHRRGNGYEAEVYRRVLEPLGVAAPRCFGVHRDIQTGTSSLFLEYLEGAEHPYDVTVLPRAAVWLGDFHRRTEPFAASSEAAFLTRYDRDFYTGWARRTAAFTEPLGEQYSWVAGVCERFVQHGAPELERRPTVIHGEYYRNNVLLQHRQLYAIDWESCALGAAEVDLAMLIEGWPDEPIGEVERHYANERWPGGAVDFSERLALAQVYVHFRWLGDQLHWTPHELWRYKELRIASERAGLLS